jgi:uncharacterized membrane protein
MRVWATCRRLGILEEVPHAPDTRSGGPDPPVLTCLREARLTTATTSGSSACVRTRLRSRFWPRLAVHWQTLAAFGLSGCAWAIFAWLSIAQHHAYNTHAYDLSWFDQAAWNTTRGNLLANSFSHGTYFKEHFSPVLLLFGVLYLLWRGPETLLFVQAAVAALAAIPLYFAASIALRSRAAGLMFAAAYLLAPHLHGYVLFDFHPDIIAVPFVFTALAFLAAHRPRAALMVLLPAFLVKEDVGIVAAGFALFFWLFGYRREARRLFAGSVVFVVLAEALILGLPHLLHWGTSGEQGRYRYLIAGRLNDPVLVWNHLSGPLQSEAAAYMFGSEALLPLAGPAGLAAAPDMLANLLAEHKPQLQLTLQYPIYPLTLLLAASIVNARLLLRAKRLQSVWERLRIPVSRRAPLLASLVLLAETASWLIGSPLGLHVHPQRFHTTAHTAALERIVRLVPPERSVSAQSSILPHLSERGDIREFPQLDGASYVVIDRKGFVAWDAGVAGYARILANLSGSGYCPLAEDDGVELWAVDSLCPGP